MLRFLILKFLRLAGVFSIFKVKICFAKSLIAIFCKSYESPLQEHEETSSAASAAFFFLTANAVRNIRYRISSHQKLPIAYRSFVAGQLIQRLESAGCEKIDRYSNVKRNRQGSKKLIGICNVTHVTFAIISHARHVLHHRIKFLLP